MKKLLQLALVPMLALVLASPATVQEDCAAQGMRQLESGACAPYIGGVAPANGVAYEPDELWAINDWRHVYDQVRWRLVLAAVFDWVLVLGLISPIGQGLSGLQPFSIPKRFVQSAAPHIWYMRGVIIEGLASSLSFALIHRTSDKRYSRT